MTPEISAIVPTHGRPASLARCLRALGDQTLAPGRFEVIVVDDGSEPPVPESPPEGSDPASGMALRVVRQGRMGPAAARNRGAAEARGQFLAFTDDDCEPSPDWLAGLLTAMSARPDALIGGGIRNALAQERYPAATQAIMDFVYAEQARGRRPPLYSSSNMAMSATAFASLGGFSADFPDAAGEDYDLCWRWHETGRPTQYLPDIFVVHRHPVTARDFLRQHFTYGRGLRRMRYRRRLRTGHGTGLDLPFLVRLVASPLATRNGGAHATRPGASLSTAMLIAISQAATATGAAVEWIHPTHRQTTSDKAGDG